jgi:glycosyltransferase involved in cell wall biosynthesis
VARLAEQPQLTTECMTVVHLTASPCYGGTERQMLELGRELHESCRSVYVSFLEEQRCWDFVHEARRQGFASHAVKRDTPRLLAALAELTALLRDVRADLLCCHGYKANLLGLLAARRVGIPIISVSHGWTGESLRVRLFEALDRRVLRRMDRVVCVSEAQARKVRRAGVPDAKVRVICDAVRGERFAEARPEYRRKLEEMFPRRPRLIVGAAGRLSPEKGFQHLVDAAGRVAKEDPSIGFVLFGDGPLRSALAQRIDALGLDGAFRLAGFSPDLDLYYPQFDLFVLPSFTEGLPNVVLEAFAAGVPVVATAVGGTPEVVEDGVNGRLVAPGDAAALARRIAETLADDDRRRVMGLRGQATVHARFSFARQARRYESLFGELVSPNGKTRS